MPWAALAQFALEPPFSLYVRPVFQGEKIALAQPLATAGGDTILLHTARFYLGKFVFWKNGQAIFEEKSRYHLLDLEEETTLALRFEVPANLLFDTVQFDLGVDSLTTVSGAMGSDLDPTKGMFWTWQSGYIQVKLEGVFQRRKGFEPFRRSDTEPPQPSAFQFHLGGYLPPFQAVRTVKVGRVSNPTDLRAHPTDLSVHPADLRLDFDLTSFFEAVDWAKKRSIMSPGAEAVRLFGALSTAFSIHEN